MPPPSANVRKWRKAVIAAYDALMNGNSNQPRLHIALRHIFCASAGS
jgi:hypothetical protein